MKITTYRVGLALGVVAMLAALWPLLFPFRLTEAEAAAIFDDRIAHYVGLMQETGLTGSEAAAGEEPGPFNVLGDGSDPSMRWRSFYAASTALKEALELSPRALQLRDISQRALSAAPADALTSSEVALLLDQPRVRAALAVARDPGDEHPEPPQDARALPLLGLLTYLAIEAQEAGEAGSFEPYRRQTQLSIDLCRRGELIMRAVGSVALIAPPEAMPAAEAAEIRSMIQATPLTVPQGALAQTLTALRYWKAAATEPDVPSDVRGDMVYTMMEVDAMYGRLVAAAAMNDVAKQTAVYEDAEDFWLTLSDEDQVYAIHVPGEDAIAKRTAKKITELFVR